MKRKIDGRTAKKYDTNNQLIVRTIKAERKKIWLRQKRTWNNNKAEEGIPIEKQEEKNMKRQHERQKQIKRSRKKKKRKKHR